MPQVAGSVSDDCILVSGEQVAANLQVTLAPGCLSMTAGSDQNCCVWHVDLVYSNLCYRSKCEMNKDRMPLNDIYVWSGLLCMRWGPNISLSNVHCTVHQHCFNTPQDAFQWQLGLEWPGLHCLGLRLRYHLDVECTYNQPCPNIPQDAFQWHVHLSGLLYLYWNSAVLMIKFDLCNEGQNAFQGSVYLT